MSKILFIILFLFIKENISFQTSHNITNINGSIEPGISKTFYLDYVSKTEIDFNISANYDNSSQIQVNIRSINCKINVYSKGNKDEIENENKEFYDFTLVYSNKTITVDPVKDTIGGFWKENYGLKKCFLSINSYYISKEFEPKIKIENKEENYIYFDTSKYKQINISYNITNVSNNSFASLGFKFEEGTFEIDILYINANNNEKNQTMIKTIENSTFIYLNNEFLTYNDSENTGGTLYVQITNKENITTFIFFKIIEENNTCLLEKNALNFGFITSKSTYQYYYTEILPGEAGELMLHNKRLYGVLYAKIVSKNITIDPYNISEYPHENNITKLDPVYSKEKLKLNFSTYYMYDSCKNGCYILITYEQIKSEEEFPLIGYEYTILSRNWNYTDSITEIIDIPSNEYIIGCFDFYTTPSHYYSIHIPENIDKIMIQLEGNYFAGFYEPDRKKINTWIPEGHYTQLEMNNSIQNVFIVNRTNFTEDHLSFLFIYYSYDYIKFSYYYFRVSFIKENEEEKYLPLDSNLGNLCLPEFNSNTNLYYCYFILKNDYNELDNAKFAISSENQNELYGIDILIKNKSTIINYTTNFTYVYDEIISNVDYILFKFEFINNETKAIISSFADRIGNIYPQLYSCQMCYLDNFKKIYNLNLSDNFYLKYQFLYGDLGIYNYSIDEYDYIKITQNFKRKPLIIPLDKNFSFNTSNSKHLFYYQLVTKMQVIEVEEIKAGEPLIRLLKVYFFPLYYYIKIKTKNYVNMDINIEFNIYTSYPKKLYPNLGLKAYIINARIIDNIISGDFSPLDSYTTGYYSDAFGIGFLEVNKKLEHNDTDNYLLIEIRNLNEAYSYKDSISAIIISYKEFDEDNNNTEYMLPVNKYIIESLYGKNNKTRYENKYCIYNTKENKNPILIEISSEYNNETEIYSESKLIDFNDVNKKERGFIKYLINDTNNKINFVVKNTGDRKFNYLIRYSYYYPDEAKTFIFDDKNLNTEMKNNTIIFNYIEVKTPSDILNIKGTYLFITGTLYVTDNTLNSSYILNKINSPYINQTINFFNSSSNSSWTLEFNDVPKNENFSYSYDLQLQILALPLDNFLNEEYLLYKIEAIWKNKIPDPEGFNKNIFIYIFVPIGAVFLPVALFFIIKFIKLKKRSDSFQQEMKTLLFSNDIQKNILVNEKELSKNDSDYENTFI